MASKRISQSFTDPMTIVSQAIAPAADVDEWKEKWHNVAARDLIDSRIVTVDSETTVEEALEKLLSEDTPCLILENASDLSYQGLFDFSDVNAFLTLAATQHTMSLDDLPPNVAAIVDAAKAGPVPIHLVSNLSEKNPLQTLPYDATVINLLELFSKGTHRVLIQSAESSSVYLGLVSDRSLLSWFSGYACRTPAFQTFLSNPLPAFALPSLNLHLSIVAATSDKSVLDAMKLMSEEGVSSIAVIDEGSGSILSAVSVTDVGKIVAPSQSNQILSSPLHQFVARIKSHDGSTDGVDKYPVYSILVSSPLSLTIQKLLATNAHRLFITTESLGDSSPISPSPSGHISGLVSVVDILSIFARLADLPDVDPTRMRHHRRASTSSSSSGGSRSGSRSRVSRNSSLRSPGPVTTKSNRNSLSLASPSPV